MLSGRLSTSFFDRTSWLVTPITFKKELCAFTTTKPTHCISIPSQLIASSLVRRKSLQVTQQRQPFILWVKSFRLEIVDSDWLIQRNRFNLQSSIYNRKSLDSSSLWWATTIVRDRSRVTNRRNSNTCIRNRTNSRFATAAWTFYANFTLM